MHTPTKPSLQEIDFDRVRGDVDDLLEIVPGVPAVYSWHRRFRPPAPEHQQAEEFAAYVLSEIARPHAVPRQARVGPVYRVHLESERSLPEGKIADLLRFCADLTFRRELHALLADHADTFAPPLYVGRTRSLRKRLHQHFLGETGLRERLQTAGIEITTARVRYVDLSALYDENEDDDAAIAVIEDVLSRLFFPPFTVRYG
jgi:hypothetical protein